jgi:hypothetical protein
MYNVYEYSHEKMFIDLFIMLFYVNAGHKTEKLPAHYVARILSMIVFILFASHVQHSRPRINLTHNINFFSLFLAFLPGNWIVLSTILWQIMVQQRNLICDSVT